LIGSERGATIYTNLSYYVLAIHILKLAAANRGTCRKESGYESEAFQNIGDPAFRAFTGSGSGARPTEGGSS
jgi:hypothetical protein